MFIYLAISNDENLRIIKAFVHNPYAKRFIEEWNKKNKDDEIHLETYKISQEGEGWD